MSKILADVFIGHVHNVGELIEALQLFDRDMPICLLDADGDKANTIDVNFVTNAVSYDSDYDFIQADSLVLNSRLD